MRTIPDPGLPDDDGGVDPRLAAALAAYGEDAEPTQARHHEVLAALQDTRLLVPVVALLGEVEVGPDGLAREKTSDMAAVLMTGADGRRALLSFTGMVPLQTWKADARPVPVPARVAAQSAIQEGAAALLVDVAGPTMLVVEGEELVALATGQRLVRVGPGWAWLSTRADPG